ncbi:MAG TPA: DUF937 domain-containing protein [Flavobacterium sp.]|uniref:DUF937 domain-containing protein n=1 Tax=Flavobacterium sp. TaxID=239 RepID=UPI002BFF7A6D|nr:DUF937 domain-containing protein [Flavobacterium sp.]HSD14797.1 DUF937 domain-containing protein [Flavobacterium sp.]
MDSSLLNQLKGYVTPDVISQAGGILGESESGITNSISAAIPTLLSGFVNKSNDSGFMSSVMNLVTETQNSGNVLLNLPPLLNGGKASDIGSKLLDLLFGGKQSSVTDLIANAGGIKSSSAGSLLSMAGAMILAYFGKSGMSSSAVTNLLSSERNNIFGALPAGLGSLLGFSDNYRDEARYAASPVQNDDSGGGFPKWLLALLLVGGGILLLYMLTKGCNKEKVEENVETVTDSVKVNMDSLGDDIKDAATEVKDAAVSLGEFLKIKLANGVELNAPELGIENQLVKWIEDKTKVVDKTTWFNFDRLLFDTGKATLQPESQEQLKNIAEILKAYPAVEIKLGGYTDNVGDPAANLKLSDERAKSVMAELVKLGIPAARMAAEGYGEQHPVASNDTEEGRAQNRRISIRVTKK